VAFARVSYGTGGVEQATAVTVDAGPLSYAYAKSWYLRRMTWLHIIVRVQESGWYDLQCVDMSWCDADKSAHKRDRH
jgi:hypothetical protein